MAGSTRICNATPRPWTTTAGPSSSTPATPAIAGRGRVYQAVQRYAEALADFSRAIELDPGFAWAIACRGRVHQTAQRYDEALADYSRAIELDPGFAGAIANRGQVYLPMRRCDEALADLDRAIELDPGNADAFVDRAKIYWRMLVRKSPRLHRQTSSSERYD